MRGRSNTGSGPTAVENSGVSASGFSISRQLVYISFSVSQFYYGLSDRPRSLESLRHESRTAKRSHLAKGLANNEDLFAKEA